MLRSMFTAITSLNLHQTYLDVIADNLANANTTAFKASRVVFQDQFAQIMSPGAGPSATSGGINPTQVGLGVKLGYVTPTFTQGMLQSTGRNSDLAIQGDGFFIYDQGADRRYSREASLEIDSNGYLVNNATGLRIQGWQVPAGSITEIDTNQPISTIQIPLSSTLARATTTTTMGGNLNAGAAVGANVDTTIGVYDSLGNLRTVQVRFTRSDSDTWAWSVTGPTGSGAAATGDLNLNFDTNGQFISPTPPSTTPAKITLPAANGSAAMSVTLDLSSLTMLGDASNVTATFQDGLAAGSVEDIYAAPKTGEVYALYSNGLKQRVGQLALAHFTNPAGMLRSGNNLFQAGLNSGEPQVGAAQSGSLGAIMSGHLEGSNVDMAQEFTNMILAQRGFQASSRIISTSDEILQELVNLKR